MPATGYIQVHAYSSFAQLPLQDVAITVTATDGTAIAMRLTDRSGKITPIELPVPELAAGQSPDTGEIPFTTVNLTARLKGYEQIIIQRLQVFPDTLTVQNLELIPLSEMPNAWDQVEDFDTPPQNL
ncbi:MAG: spore cortex-lytic protein [Oscillospiraceae bacterium]|nr:spore cortex-lytic protein [Oscillospiraceae bacterium]